MPIRVKPETVEPARERSSRAADELAVPRKSRLRGADDAKPTRLLKDTTLERVATAHADPRGTTLLHADTLAAPRPSRALHTGAASTASLRAPALLRRVRDSLVSPNTQIKTDALGLPANSQMGDLVSRVAGSPKTVSASQFDLAVRQPPNVQFLTSDGLQSLRKLLFAGARSGVTVGSLPIWAQTISKDIVGARTTIASSDLDQYQANLKVKFANGQTAIPNSQRIGVTRAQLASLGGGSDVMMTTGDGGQLLFRESFIASYNPARRVSNWVSFTLSAADLAIRQPMARVDSFITDPALKKQFGQNNVATPGDYNGSGVDEGHQADRDSGADQKAQIDSYLMSNMAPQTAELNRQSWRTIEDGIRQIIAATGGKATVTTGSLFVDKDMKPLADKDLQWIGPDKDNAKGTRRIAVPTHSYKVVYIDMPNGEQATFAYIIANVHNLPTLKAGIIDLLQKSAVSVAQVEKITGYKFFAGLDPATAGRLKPRTDGLQVVTRAIPPAGPVVVPPPLTPHLVRQTGALVPRKESTTDALFTLWPKQIQKPQWLLDANPASAAIAP